MQKNKMERNMADTTLNKAYPNYFLDAVDFLSVLKKQIIEQTA
jgi:hypothetical protein